MNQFIKLRNQLIDCSSRKSGTCKEDNTYKCAVRIIQNYVNGDIDRLIDLKVQARCEISRGWTEKANEQLRIAVAIFAGFFSVLTVNTLSGLVFAVIVLLLLIIFILVSLARQQDKELSLWNDYLMEAINVLEKEMQK